ncbi:hypothetical protein FB451DRAFT_1434337 [Mycena latifolia]|nr:hypothetical protein FB451DRAFT_1434337 [Mycena latifolia]
MAPSINTLSDDLLLYILPLCDISSVLAISQTCKYLHFLSGDRLLWTVLLETLTLRCLRDPLPGEDLRALSAPALLALAKRAVRGSHMWLDASPARAPALPRMVHIPCDGFQRAEPLPGGRYVVATHPARVMLLDATKGGALVGIHDTQESAHIHRFCAEVARDGGSMVVMLHTETFAVPRRKGLEIVRFSLEVEGCVDAPLILYADWAVFNGGFWCDPQLCGEYASIIVFAKPRWRLILVDWAAETYVLVDLPQRSRTALISGYLILVTRSSPATMQISVHEIQSLQDHWRPLHDIDWASPMPLSTSPPLYAETALLDATRFPESAEFRMSARESPLARDQFNIHVHFWNAPPMPRTPQTLLNWLFARTQAEEALPSATLLRFSLTLASAFTPALWRVREPLVLRFAPPTSTRYRALRAM